MKLGFIACCWCYHDHCWLFTTKENQLFAVALQGVGLASRFLTLIFSIIFAVMQFNHSQYLFVILLLVTVYLSLKQQALYLAMLALSMAYLAPLVIPQNHPDVIFLFAITFN